MDDENQSQENKNYGFSETCEKKNADFHFLIDSQIILLMFHKSTLT